MTGDVTASGSYKPDSEPVRTSPPRSENRARSQVVTVRIDGDERVRWSAFAQSQGMTLAGLLRLATEAAILQEQMRGGFR